MPTAVVTGASSGLGRELALLLAARGEHVVAVARRGDALAELAEASSRIDAVTADLSIPEGRARLVGEVGDINILVNSAGLGAAGSFVAAPPRSAREWSRSTWRRSRTSRLGGCPGWLSDGAAAC